MIVAIGVYGTFSTPVQSGEAFRPVEEIAGLPRVLLIGDSVSVGYTLATRELLRGIANLQRIPDNGGPTWRGLDSITKWLGYREWDVIHFNWGLHDLRYRNGMTADVPIAIYEENLRRLVALLERSGATLIWCATTPVPAGVTPLRKNQDVIAYNAVARRVMEENGIAINDLYSYALPELSWIQREGSVHFSLQGSAILAKQVAASIELHLPKPGTSNQKEGWGLFAGGQRKFESGSKREKGIRNLRWQWPPGGRPG